MDCNRYTLLLLNFIEYNKKKKSHKIILKEYTEKLPKINCNFKS